MALTYYLYYVTPANGQAQFTQPVSCDIPPVLSTKSVFSAQYRDLPGSTFSPASPSANIATNVTLGASPALSTAPTPSGESLTYFISDDAMHAPWRQDPTHMEDYLVFTDSLMRVCGEFPSPPNARVSWNNTGQPGTIPTAAITSPH